MTLWGELEDGSWCYAGQLPGKDSNARKVQPGIDEALARYRQVIIRPDDAVALLIRILGNGP
jgi:hypothetical protein